MSQHTSFYLKSACNNTLEEAMLKEVAGNVVSHLLSVVEAYIVCLLREKPEIEEILEDEEIDCSLRYEENDELFDMLFDHVDDEDREILIHIPLLYSLIAREGIEFYDLSVQSVQTPASREEALREVRSATRDVMRVLVASILNKSNSAATSRSPRANYPAITKFCNFETNTQSDCFEDFSRFADEACGEMEGIDIASYSEIKWYKHAIDDFDRLGMVIHNITVALEN